MTGPMGTRKCALVVGVGGLVGNNLARYLLGLGDWDVIGISRRSSDLDDRIQHVQVDLNDRDACAKSIGQLTQVTHVFYAAWAKRSSEEEMCVVNEQMIAHLLDPLDVHAPHLQHVCLVTGTKHYGCHLGPFKTPTKEDDPRLTIPVFYYNLEDYIQRKRWTWSVARPHTIIGFAHGNLMNMGVTLAVYATIAKELHLPFRFSGAPLQYYGVVDIVNVDLLVRHLVWSSTTPHAANQAFNVVNGDVFRWEQMWPKITDFFSLPQAEYSGMFHLEKLMAGKEDVWTSIVKKYHLQPYQLHELAQWWHTDGDFCRNYEAFNDMSRSRELGFLEYRNSEKTLLNLFRTLRENRIIP